MNRPIKILLSVVFASLLLGGLSGCKTPTKVDRTFAYNDFGVECLGVNLDGSQTLRAWGKGTNKAHAIEQAKKNALRAVMFKGITSGGECNKRPLITEVNAEEKYEAYFNRFFADGGIYTQFATLDDEKRHSRQKSADNSMENWGVVVNVDRAALRDRLVADDVINP